MNDDLISRKELRKAFKESGYFTGPQLHWVRLVIDQAPTVLHDNYSMGYQDGVRKVLSERPQGEWEWVQYDANPNIGNWHCSECRYIPHGKKEYQKTNFCPNCGAKMKEN